MRTSTFFNSDNPQRQLIAGSFFSSRVSAMFNLKLVKVRFWHSNACKKRKPLCELTNGFAWSESEPKMVSQWHRGWRCRNSKYRKYWLKKFHERLSVINFFRFFSALLPQQASKKKYSNLSQFGSFFLRLSDFVREIFSRAKTGKFQGRLKFFFNLALIDLSLFHCSGIFFSRPDVL